MAVKIKLMRLGKMRAPYYRIVVADARTKRDGRVIETIGKYHPKEEPSFIQVDAERAAYWLGVGAQPTEPVQKILSKTGDWQKFKGEAAPEPLKVAAPKVDKKVAFEAAAKESLGPAARHHAEEEGRARSRGGRRPRGCCRGARRRAARRAARRGSRRRAACRGSRCGGCRRGARCCEAPTAEAEARRGRGRRGRDPAEAEVLEEALEHLVKGIVDNPDDVTVDMVSGRRGRTLEVRVNPEDLGKVIGRSGRTAKALRTVVAAIGGKGVRVDVVDTDEPDPAAQPDLVVVGRIGRPQGMKGEVTVEVRTDDPDDRFADGPCS